MTTRPAFEQTVFDFAIREINALEERIVTAEDDADGMLWEQARQIVEQLPTSSTRKIAAEWVNTRTGEVYSHVHVHRVSVTFDRYAGVTPRPRFRDAYNEVAHGDRTKERRDERIATMREASTGNRPLETPIRYPILYVDPPWRYEHVKTESRAIENQYPTMTHEDICALPLDEITTDDAVMFMWATSPKLAEAIDVLTAWGFSYRTSMVWVKDHIGMGYYARQRHELLLIATKGEPPTPEPADRPDSVVTAPRGAHSAKPDLIYDLIERMYPTLPRIEMFARGAREGWERWGNQSA